ncbi:MAG: hypothetical protein WAM75_19345 [Xanthobacteraceae bacterium]
MPTPTQLWNPWLALASQTVLLGLEAQRVMALRMMRLAAGGPRGHAEAQRMVTEKLAAVVEAQAAAVSGAVEGRSAQRTGKKVLGVYRKRVRANRRRLAR